MTESPISVRRWTWVRWLAAGLVGAVAGGLITWALATVLTPSVGDLDATKFTLVEVVPGEVGSSLNLNTAAEWVPIPIGSNLAAGTVTSVNIDPGQEVGVGTVLYTVNLRPVVVAPGAVPAFRSLSVGSQGQDVAQLQSMLSTLGFYSGPADGEMGYGTSAAVSSWQRSMGVEPDGEVQAGDIIFVPDLPTRVTLDAKVVFRGAALGGGERILQGLPAAPIFSIAVTESQAALMPAGTKVEIASPEGASWAAVVAEQKPQEADSSVLVSLSGEDGTAICGTECAEVPVGDKSLLRSEVLTVESVSGLVVPSAALLSSANGSLFVTDEEGKRRDVKVVTSARGMSVIEGVAAGTKVRLPASEGSQ